MRLVKGKRDQDKEDALNAKIATIRQANRIIERRHQEVEADRLEAERNNASVTLKIKKRSKTNSMSSSTDSEIAELNVRPKDKNGNYEEKEKNDMKIEKAECGKYQEDAPGTKISAVRKDKEVIEQGHLKDKIDQLEEARNDVLDAPKIDKAPNFILPPGNSVRSKIAEFDLPPKSREGVKKKALDVKIVEAEWNTVKDAMSAETFANNSIDYEIAQLKLAIESEIEYLRGYESKVPVTKKTEVQTGLEKKMTKAPELPKKTMVDLQVESDPSGKKSCDNCKRKHKAKLIIEQAALLADW